MNKVTFLKTGLIATIGKNGKSKKKIELNVKTLFSEFHRARAALFAIWTKSSSSLHHE